jgi:hypothetical protein
VFGWRAWFTEYCESVKIPLDRRLCGPIESI